MNTPGPPDRAALPTSMLDEDPAELLTWGRTVLADAGYVVLPVVPHLRRRAWSTVARLETDRGPVWVKGNARAFAVEAALLMLLRRHVPDHVVSMIGVDPVRCRMVTVDGGSTLSDADTDADADADADATLAAETDWATLLTGYADLQRRMAPYADELLRIGLPDLRPARLAGWYRAALDRVDAEPVIAALLTAPERAALESVIPVTGALAAELGDDPTPATVEHNDLHRNNVFAADPATGAGLRLFDWGDAVVTHPFLGLASTLTRATAPDRRTDDGARPAIRADPLRNAYLRCWSPTGDVTAEMRRTVAVAQALSPVLSAASWLRMPLADNPAWARTFVGFLTEHARRAPTPGPRPR